MKKQNLKLKSIQLASRSPRRKEILSNLYEEVEVVDFHFDEHVPKGLDVRHVSSFLAEQKMIEFLKSGLPVKERIITADTIVCYPETGRILGKPKSIVEAREMLSCHFGKEHLVITAVCYFDTVKDIQTIITDEVRVKFKPIEQIPDKVIKEYLTKLPPNGPMDKAGAYGIQEEHVYRFMIESVVGDINTVVGFPLEKFISIIINSSSGDVNP